MDSTMLTLHLLGIIFFVGGQMAMIAAVRPTLDSTDGNEDVMRQIATRFGIGSAIALLLIIGTGTWMALEDNLFSEPLLHAKLGLLALIFVLTGLHTKVPYARALSLSIFVLSLVLVVLGVQLSQV
jgi:uncharacterized membrane protein